MPDLGTLAVFCAASLALAVVPGPAVLYIVTQSVDQGRLAGLVSALGIGVGGLVHVAAATIGLSSLLASSATAFAIVKYAGAAYLVVLGVRRLLTRETADVLDSAPPRPRRRLFLDGVVVNVLNPKTALFFLAFLPQFVDPGAGAVAPQMLVLGTMLVGLGVLSDGTYALLAAGAGNKLRSAARTRRRLDKLSGGVFVGLGLAAAFAGEPKHS